MAFNNDEILTLAKAGFTAQQIAALNAVKAEGTPAPQDPLPADPGNIPAPIQAPTVPNQVQTAPAPVGLPIMAQPMQAPVQVPEQAAASTDEILKAINGLTATMQQGFLQGAEQPTQPTAETILAEIINPPSKDKK